MDAETSREASASPKDSSPHSAETDVALPNESDTADPQGPPDGAATSGEEEDVPAVGTVLDFGAVAYTLEERLGRGGMGVVYRARQVGAGGFVQSVAIKRVRHDGGPWVERSFLDEAHVLSRLHHANIARVYAFHRWQGSYYLVMEYIEGLSLYALLGLARRNGHRFSQSVACAVMAEVADALDYAHQATDEAGRPLQIIHRDVSPTNILIGKEGRVVLVDFGVALTRQEGRTATPPAFIKGKAPYLSPEQVKHLPLDARSDLFSVGTILVEMLTGEVPFGWADVPSTLLRIARVTPEYVASKLPGVSEPLLALCQKLLAARPDQRFATGREVATALRHHARLYDGPRSIQAEVKRLLAPPDAKAPLPPWSSRDAAPAMNSGLTPELAAAMMELRHGEGAPKPADEDPQSNQAEVKASRPPADVLEAVPASEPTPQRPDSQPVTLAVSAVARRARVVRLAAVAAGLAVALVVLVREGTVLPSSLWLAGSPSRLLEARVSRAEADQWRPYHVSASATPALAPPPPLMRLGVLELRGAARGIAVAYLIRGQAEQAAVYLERAGAAPEDELDRAATALLKKNPTEALERVDRVLRAAPRDGRALWNRALALRDLGLPLSAADAFRQVSELGEPGWSDDARRRSAELRSGVGERRAAWEALADACRQMVAAGTPLPRDQVRRIPGRSRACFYDAVLAAPTRERALALLPVAAELDRLAGDGTATAFAQRMAARASEKRRPLAETYAALATAGLPPDRLAAFVDELRRSREADLLLGALPQLPRASSYAGEYAALAAKAGDPWFQLLAEEKQAEADLDVEQPGRAEERLRRALQRCDGDHLDARCARLEQWLSTTHAHQHRLVEAREHALRALARAHAGGEWLQERWALISLGQIARANGNLPLTRAYLEEVLQSSSGNCAELEFIHTNLAMAYQKDLRPAEARRELDELVAECRAPASFTRLAALADLARLGSRLEDERSFQEGLGALRATGTLGPGRLALLTHLEGRFQIERDRTLGQSLLRAAIGAAEKLPDSDADARKARAYSYTSLLLDVGQHGDYPRALALFAEELGTPPPARCALGVTVDDERTLVVAVGPGGELQGRYDAGRTAPLSGAQGLVPPELASALRACPSVEVIARSPLGGQAELLPPELAWSYRLSRGGPRAPTPAGPARRLIVTETRPPASLGLTLLAPELPAPDSSTRVLRAEQATPRPVLEAMRDATEVQLYAHGLVDPEQSEASFIALSAGEDGAFALTAGALERVELKSRPVVLLAACHAAQGALYLHESYGLPAAFIRAGARAVLAATDEIPDTAADFFGPVLQRIREGQPPAIALRDARAVWVATGKGRWVEKVLLFE